MTPMQEQADAVSSSKLPGFQNLISASSVTKRLYFSSEVYLWWKWVGRARCETPEPGQLTPHNPGPPGACIGAPPPQKFRPRP